MQYDIKRGRNSITEYTVRFKGRLFTSATLAYSLLHEFYWNPSIAPPPLVPSHEPCVCLNRNRMNPRSRLPYTESRLNLLRLDSRGYGVPRLFFLAERKILFTGNRTNNIGSGRLFDFDSFDRFNRFLSRNKEKITRSTLRFCGRLD